MSPSGASNFEMAPRVFGKFVDPFVKQVLLKHSMQETTLDTSA